MKRGLSFAVPLILALTLAACSSRTETVMVTDYCKDTYVTDHYTEGLDGIVSEEYERIYPEEHAGRINIGVPGPTEPKYRGVIRISEEEGKKLWERFDWKMFNENMPDIGKAYELIDESDDWYISDDFNKEIFRSEFVGVNSARFNGKDTIIFDIQRF